MQERIAEHRTEVFGDIVAAALSADQQALGHQFLDRLAQRRPRHAELLGQHALGRQALARLQRPFENHRLQTLDDVIRQPAMSHLTKSHFLQISRSSPLHQPFRLAPGSLPSPPRHNKSGCRKSTFNKSRTAAN
ncbi:hypothetical protein D3C80_1488340 [compost metagenome]